MLKRLNDQELKSLLDEFLEEVEKRFSIDKAVLYGSYAKGEARDTSDVDLLIVSSDLPVNSTKGLNAYEIEKSLDKIYTDIELIAVHPEKLNQETTKWFYDEIFRTGKVLR